MVVLVVLFDFPKHFSEHSRLLFADNRDTTDKKKMNCNENSVESAKRVLVTGGAGYLGSTLVPILLQRGYQVVVYDKFMWGAGPLLANVGNPHLEIVPGDILDKGLLAEHMSTCDAVIHLAAIVGYPACEKNKTEAVQVCIAGHLRFCVGLCQCRNP